MTSGSVQCRASRACRRFKAREPSDEPLHTRGGDEGTPSQLYSLEPSGVEEGINCWSTQPETGADVVNAVEKRHLAGWIQLN